MPQYISTRYSIPLAEAAAVIAIRSGIVLVVCAATLPAVGIYFGSRRSDIGLSPISAAVIALGFLGMGFATNLPIHISALILTALGWGLSSFLRCFSVSIVNPGQAAQLNSFISMFEVIGLMIESAGLQVEDLLNTTCSIPWISLASPKSPRGNYYETGMSYISWLCMPVAIHSAFTVFRLIVQDPRLLEEK